VTSFHHTPCCSVQFSWGEQVTQQIGATLPEEEKESDLLYDLATSILREYKAEASLSDLNTAIYLFREAVNRRPAPHPLQLDSLGDLAAALVTRFLLTDKREDLHEAFSLYDQIATGTVRGIETGDQPQFYVCTWSHSDPRVCTYHLRRPVHLPSTTSSLVDWMTGTRPTSANLPKLHSSILINRLSCQA
jgi:hypothetical protein